MKTTCPLLSTRAMKSLLVLDTPGLCPCHTSRPLALVVDTVIRIVSVGDELEWMNIVTGSSIEPPELTKRADSATSLETKKTQNTPSLQANEPRGECGYYIIDIVSYRHTK